MLIVSTNGTSTVSQMIHRRIYDFKSTAAPKLKATVARISFSHSLSLGAGDDPPSHAGDRTKPLLPGYGRDVIYAAHALGED